MDTLSSSVSPFNLHALQPLQSRPDGYHPALPPPHRRHHPHLSSAAKPSPSISSFSPDNNNNNNHDLIFTSTSSSSSSFPVVKNTANPLLFHHRAATGYAAALLDAARCNNSLQAAQRDVKRFAKLLKKEQLQGFLSDPFVDEKEKGRVLKEVAERGRFHGHLVALMKMLVERSKLKGRVGVLVGETLAEFQRIYLQLVWECQSA
ncbi:uncharacterized protein LOC127801118 [Diospyros lotus]|uniref:uncharacterized protein LOC127801118 n=1 Tax=Diospyros lotus TaxID=55363 RepID=UPI0022570C04|nr:uncharacterized protein LOC127801118 [Diospyros lotus]